jgi:hypothetical protein
MRERIRRNDPCGVPETPRPDAQAPDERITRIDMWLIQQKLPLDILIAIWSRAQFCSWVFYGDAEPEVKHTMLLRLRSRYLEFCQLPPRLQKKLWPMGWERWHAQFIEEEEMEAAKNATA